VRAIPSRLAALHVQASARAPLPMAISAQWQPLLLVSDHSLEWVMLHLRKHGISTVPRAELHSLVQSCLPDRLVMCSAGTVVQIVQPLTYTRFSNEFQIKHSRDWADSITSRVDQAVQFLPFYACEATARLVVVWLVAFTPPSARFPSPVRDNQKSKCSRAV
jgi:hypothetical protein